jgi:hypothetical protein
LTTRNARLGLAVVSIPGEQKRPETHTRQIVVPQLLDGEQWIIRPEHCGLKKNLIFIIIA